MNPLEHGQPSSPDGLVGEVRRESVQAEISLRFLTAVTLLAVANEKRTNLVVISFGSLLCVTRNCRRQGLARGRRRNTRPQYRQTQKSQPRHKGGSQRAH